MARCKKISIPRQKVCIGDLEHFVDVLDRSIDPSRIGDTDMNFQFAPKYQVYCAIHTLSRGVELFDGTSENPNVVTHRFYFHYDDAPDIESSDWINFDSKIFDIIRAVTIDERKEFIMVEANERGGDNLAGNYL